jgi:hypothetical protein
MADPVVLKNAFVAFTTSTGSSTYTEVDANKSIKLPLSKKELEDAVMGDGVEVYFPGVIAAPVSLVHRQDFGATGVDKKFWDLWNGAVPFKLKVRPVDSAVATANPSLIYSKVRVFQITPIDGAWGESLKNNIEIRPCSGCTVTRSTST